MDPMKSFFEPGSVVVIGASRDPEKLGYGVSRNLIGSGYRGKIYLVNPSGGELFERPLYSTVSDLPEIVDLGLIVVPPSIIPRILKESSQKGIKSFVILTGGFSESGTEGAALEDEIREIVRSEKLTVIGPNCIGILDTHLPLDTTFIQPPMPKPGEVAFITHSGALGAAMIDWSREEGFGFSRVISLGNQIDVSESDVLAATASMPETKVVTMYIEGIRNGKKFLQEAAKSSKIKPVIAMKVGRSDAGQRAAASHTGALAGSDIAYDAAFRRTGVLRSFSTEQMFSWAKLFSLASPPNGNRVAILTNAGGPGVTAADAVANNGLILAKFSPETKRALQKYLPRAAAIGNPVDMLASASPQVYANCLSALLSDPGVDLILVIAPAPPMFSASDLAQALVPVIEVAGKPVAVSMMGSRLVKEAVQVLRDHRIPEFAFPEEAASALGVLWRYQELKSRNSEVISCSLQPDQKVTAARIFDKLITGNGFSDPALMDDLLKVYGLPVLPLRYASDSETAVAASEEMGFPIAMKMAVSGISHKSDLGGVLLNLESRSAVIKGFEALKLKAAAVLEREKKFGVHLQKMAPTGHEVIVGAVRDPVFGPMVMFGAGGTEVEGLGDVAFALAPVTNADLDDMVTTTWAGRKLKGYRQHPPADISAVRDAIVRIGQLLVDCPEIAEVEVNPLIVLPEGQGCRAVDIRMMIESGWHLEGDE